MSDDNGVMDEWASALQEQENSEKSAGDGAASSDEALAAEWEASMGGGDSKQGAKMSIQDFNPPDFDERARSELGSDEVNLDLILDIPVTLSVEIGRTDIQIRNLLQLNQGSVVELDRLAGEPMDVFVNGSLVAHGEVVVVNDKFGVRLTDVVSPAERVKKIND